MKRFKPEQDLLTKTKKTDNKDVKCNEQNILKRNEGD